MFNGSLAKYHGTNQHTNPIGYIDWKYGYYTFDRRKCIFAETESKIKKSLTYMIFKKE